MNDHVTNCRNCAAPLNGRGDCEYCGTKHQGPQEMISTVKLTGEGVLFECRGMPKMLIPEKGRCE